MKEINEIAKNFKFEGKLLNIRQNTQGNINKTYILDYDKNTYIIQQINDYVFKKPTDVMYNIELVSNYLLKQKNNQQKALEIVYTTDNNNCLIYNDKYYRAYKFIDNSISYDKLDSKDMAYLIGKAFGNWEKSLEKFPVNKLKTTIKDFHNTKKYYQKFLLSLKTNYQNRKEELNDTIEELLQQKEQCSCLINQLGKTIPYRISHNDTKVNNILIDKNTNKPTCVIDLDTVMKSSILFDLGDGIRSACSNTYEDDKNYENATLNIEYTKAYLQGFLEETKDFLTKEEKDNLIHSIAILTLELTIRFITDYLNGDLYFKIDYPDQNKVRALNQLHLYHNILSHEQELNNYVQKLINN